MDEFKPLTEAQLRNGLQRINEALNQLATDPYLNRHLVISKSEIVRQLSHYSNRL